MTKLLSGIQLHPETTIYGVELDELPNNIPETLREISIKGILKDGKIDASFLRKLASWRFSTEGKNLYTIVEFEDVAPSSVETLILICSNIGVGISFLPCKNEGRLIIEDNYLTTLSYATKSLLSFRSGNPFVYPISNYMEYLAANVLHKVDALEPNDEYTRSVFKDMISDSDTEIMKASIKKDVFDLVGGEDAFISSVLACAAITCDKAINSANAIR